MNSFYWCTNGKTNLKISSLAEMPAGFHQGFTTFRFRSHSASEKEFQKFAKKHKLNSMQNRIDEMCKTKSYDEIYSLLKFEDDFLNAYLEDLVLERCLMRQMMTMPKFFDTIASQLRDLYTKNSALKNRDSVKSYFLAVFRS